MYRNRIVTAFLVVLSVAVPTDGPQAADSPANYIDEVLLISTSNAGFMGVKFYAHDHI
ncbi:MAG: hypothetical protein ACYS4W_02975 [Planctomycetota bacterium]